MISFAILLLPLLLMAALLYRKISYPKGDSFALLAMSNALEGLSRMRVNHIYFWDYSHPDPTVDRFGKIQKAPYGLYLNLLNLFEPRYRFRGSQVINVILLVITGGVIFSLFYRVLPSVYLGEEERGIYAALLSSLFLYRFRVVSVALLGLTDVLNYLLLSLVMTGVHFSSFTPDEYYGAILGLFSGLAVRNRSQDLILVASLLLMMIAHGYELSVVAVFLGVALLVNIDAQIRMVADADLFSHLSAFVMQNTSSSANGGSHRRKGVLVKVFAYGYGWIMCLSRALNIYRHDSLWANLGLQLLYVPFSVGVIVSSGSYSPLFTFALLYTLLSILSLSLLNHRVYSSSGESVHCFFGGRQALILYLSLTALHAIAVSVLIVEGKDSYIVLYLVGYFVALVHQLYRFVAGLFSDAIDESKLMHHPVEAPSWSRELGRFLAASQDRVVLLGSYLMFGEVYEEFNLGDKQRFVDCYSELPKGRLAEILTEYGVTHVVVTPMASCFGAVFSSDGEILDDSLVGVLKRVETDSPNLHLFKVIK